MKYIIKEQECGYLLKKEKKKKLLFAGKYNFYSWMGYDLKIVSMTGRVDTQGLPDPDLLIRTCNEQRISNFLLWQLSYAEFYFTETAWPDFSKEELEKAVAAYNKRNRKYGMINEEE